MIDFLDNHDVNTLLGLLDEAAHEADERVDELIGNGSATDSPRVQRQRELARQYRNMITKIGNAEEGITTTPEMLA